MNALSREPASFSQLTTVLLLAYAMTSEEEQHPCYDEQHSQTVTEHV